MQPCRDPGSCVTVSQRRHHCAAAHWACDRGPVSVEQAALRGRGRRVNGIASPFRKHLDDADEGAREDLQGLCCILREGGHRNRCLHEEGTWLRLCEEYYCNVGVGGALGAGHGSGGSVWEAPACAPLYGACCIAVLLQRCAPVPEARGTAACAAWNARAGAARGGTLAAIELQYLYHSCLRILNFPAQEQLSLRTMGVLSSRSRCQPNMQARQ